VEDDPVPNHQQRREAARRQLERQLADRQQRRAVNRQRTLVVSISATVVLILALILTIALTSGGSSHKKPSAASTTSATTPTPSPSSTVAAATYPCQWTTSTSGTVARKVREPSTTTPPKTGTVTVAVKTTRGNLSFKLNRAAAPCTVASFVSLVQQKYYNSSPCHRLVTTGFYILQCGDPTGTGQGGPGYTIPDEATGDETYPAGTIAMARVTDVAHSGGSQFFIVYKDSPALQQDLGTQQYTVFGTVTSGLGVINKVATAGAPGGDGKPKLPITISTMSVS
jgi:peptidyl-prolyl cis-trans isomerase B (cyclophilin B)